VTHRGLIEGRRNHLALHRALHVRDFRKMTIGIAQTLLLII
jgi:hypothetical protein